MRDHLGLGGGVAERGEEEGRERHVARKDSAGPRSRCSAALEVATGKVIVACYPRHRSDEFLRFLKQVARAYPRVPLHVVAANYAAHNTRR